LYRQHHPKLDYSQKKREDHKQYGSGKMEASKVKVADINTVNCFSKTIRRRLKEVKIDKLKVALKFKMILV
jgi:hypothetical protein